MNNRKAFLFITKKLKTSIIFVLLLLSNNNLYSRNKIETTIGFITLTIGFINAIGSFKVSPYLYEKNHNSSEEYLTFLENRASNWIFLLEHPDENQLNIFREELLDYYEKVLSNRSLFSKLTQNNPRQPWALFNKELEQHINQLEGYKLKYFFQKFKREKFNSNSEIYSEAFIDRVNIIGSTLIKIKKKIRAWPIYQNECFQAHQESKISAIQDSLLTFILFYYSYKLLKDNY